MGSASRLGRWGMGRLLLLQTGLITAAAQAGDAQAIRERLLPARQPTRADRIRLTLKHCPCCGQGTLEPLALHHDGLITRVDPLPAIPLQTAAVDQLLGKPAVQVKLA